MIIRFLRIIRIIIPAEALLSSSCCLERARVVQVIRFIIEDSIY